MKKTLDATVKRRNDIVHRADRSQDDPAGSRKRSAIAWTRQAVETIRVVCLASMIWSSSRLKELQNRVGGARAAGSGVTMDQAIRNKLRNVVTQCRRLLEEAVSTGACRASSASTPRQEGRGDRRGRRPDGAPDRRGAGGYRKDMLDHFEHIKALGFKPKDALDQLVREIAFTHLNRLCAYKMMEAREVYVGGQKFREAVSRGSTRTASSSTWPTTPRTSGCSTPASGCRLPPLPGLAGRAALRGDRRPVQPQRPGQPALPAAAGARRGLDLLNERGTASRDLVAGRDDRLGLPVFHAQGAAGSGPQGEPGPPQLLRTGVPQPVLHAPLRGRVPDRQHAGPHLVRDAEGGHGSRTSAATWSGARARSSWPRGRQPPKDAAEDRDDLSQEELLKLPVYIPHRPKKDPRELKILDPACGSGHFLLYCFDLLLTIYEEAYADPDLGPALQKDYPTLDDLRRAVPRPDPRAQPHGIDIDLRATQIAALALWLRCQRAYQEMGLKKDRPKITRSNIVCAEPMPGERTTARGVPQDAARTTGSRP